MTVECPVCDGTGRSRDQRFNAIPCPACHAVGVVTEQQRGWLVDAKAGLHVPGRDDTALYDWYRDDFNLGEVSDHHGMRAAVRLVDDLEVTAVARAVGVLAA